MQFPRMVCIVLLFFSASCARAADGNTLLSNCGMAVDHLDGKPSRTIPEVERGGYVLSCLSLLSGFRDGYAFGAAMEPKGSGAGIWGRAIQGANSLLSANPPIICIPQPVPTSQLARVVVRYLRDNPSRLHERDTSLVLIAFADAFPCPPRP